jgi:hypothetical protein
MDRSNNVDFEFPDVVVPGHGGGGDDAAPPGPGGGGRGPRGTPRPEPFVQSRWGVWVAVGALLLFGGQSVAAVWLSRAGMGTEALAWVLGGLMLGTFTGALIIGARYVGRHRYGGGGSP